MRFNFLFPVNGSTMPSPSPQAKTLVIPDVLFPYTTLLTTASCGFSRPNMSQALLLLTLCTTKAQSHPRPGSPFRPLPPEVHSPYSSRLNFKTHITSCQSLNLSAWGLSITCPLKPTVLGTTNKPCGMGTSLPQLPHGCPSHTGLLDFMDHAQQVPTEGAPTFTSLPDIHKALSLTSLRPPQTPPPGRAVTWPCHLKSLPLAAIPRQHSTWLFLSSGHLPLPGTYVFPAIAPRLGVPEGRAVISFAVGS